MFSKKKEYMSLREAAAFTGYSSDYVGQLIRAGKIPGKQVFSHVAWVTTEDDLREYMQKKHVDKSTPSKKDRLINSVYAIPKNLKRSLEAPRMLDNALYVVVGISVCFFLLLFYVFATSLDHRINQKAIETVEAKNTL